MNPFPGIIDGRLFGLLERWLFWVSRAGTAQSQSGHLEWIGQLGCRVDGSYKRTDPPNILGFGACFTALPELDQLLVVALIWLEFENLPRSERWQKILTALFHRSARPPTERELDRYGNQYRHRVTRALVRLEVLARAAGWL